MNRQEFNEMRREFAEYIYKYENFVKAGLINDSYYNQMYYNDLTALRKLEVENQIIRICFQMQHDGKTVDEIKAQLEANKAAYKNEILQAEAKAKLSKEIVERTEAMVDSDKVALENEYLEFCIKHHPVVQCKVTETEKDMFTAVRQLYYENKLEAFREAVRLQEGTYPEPTFEKKEFNVISAYFFDVKVNITKDYNEKSKIYPYTKFEVMKDDITKAREAGELRAKIGELKKLNVELQKDAKLNFNFDISVD